MNHTPNLMNAARSKPVNLPTDILAGSRPPASTSSKPSKLMTNRPYVKSKPEGLIPQKTTSTTGKRLTVWVKHPAAPKSTPDQHTLFDTARANPVKPKKVKPFEMYSHTEGGTQPGLFNNLKPKRVKQTPRVTATHATV